MGEHEATRIFCMHISDSSVCLYLHLSLMLCGIYRRRVFKHDMFFFLRSCTTPRCPEGSGMIELHHPTRCDPQSPQWHQWSQTSPAPCPPATASRRMEETLSLCNEGRGYVLDWNTVGKAEPWALWLGTADNTRVKPTSSC